MDEAGMQLNNRPKRVLAEDGSQAVSMATSTGKGETVTANGCCNTEGFFGPHACIIKGINKKPENKDWIPPRYVVFMSVKSALLLQEFF